MKPQFMSLWSLCFVQRELCMGRFDPSLWGPQPHNLEEETYVNMGIGLVDIINKANRKRVWKGHTRGWSGYRGVSGRQGYILWGIGEGHLEDVAFRWDHRVRRDVTTVGRVRRWNSWSKGMDEGEEGFANNLMELDACLWLVRAEVGSEKRKRWHGGPAWGPGLQGPCQILLKCPHIPDTVHGTQKGSITNFLDEGLNEWSKLFGIKPF